MPGPGDAEAEMMQVDMEEGDNHNNANDGNNGNGGNGNANIVPGLAGMELDQLEENFVVENATLDLESYINSYTGTGKLLRLIHIADHCPALRIEALKMAIAHVIENTFNVGMYQQLHRKLREAVNAGLSTPAAGGTPNPTLDSKWIEQTTKKTAVLLEKLDTDLKNYKSNSIKESIRRGFDEMGEFYLQCGDLNNALKSFSRSRDYCTSGKQVVNMCLNVIKVSIYLQNWTHVYNFVAKAHNTPDPGDEKKTNVKEGAHTKSKLRLAAGVSDLASKNYKSAANFFLQVNFDHCDSSDAISSNNIAVYAGLCALATYDRSELQEKVILSSSFKMFLELEPQIRDVLSYFYDSKYGKCLQLLDEMKGNFLLDMYLAPHVRPLYAQIRNKGMIQYFRPYASADMNRMAQSFNTSVQQLENELMILILDGKIQARIDSHNKILYAKQVDERFYTFEKSLQMGIEYERRTKMMIFRAATLRARIQVKNPAKDSQGDSSGTAGSVFKGHRERSNS